MSTVANKLDKLDHTIAKQGEANHQTMKSLGKNLTQDLNQMNNNLSQMPAAISTAMAALFGRSQDSIGGSHWWCAESRWWAVSAVCAAAFPASPTAV